MLEFFKEFFVLCLCSVYENQVEFFINLCEKCIFVGDSDSVFKTAVFYVVHCADVAVDIDFNGAHVYVVGKACKVDRAVADGTSDFKNSFAATVDNGLADEFSAFVHYDGYGIFPCVFFDL